MNILKKSILPILLLIFVIIFCVSVHDSVEKEYDTEFSMENIMDHNESLTENGSRSLFHEKENEATVKYITDYLDSLGLVNEDTTEKSAYQVQEYVGEDIDYQNFYLKNVIVHIPSNSDKKVDDAVMFMGHFDSVPMGEGASDDGVAVSVMLEAIRYYIDKLDNGFKMDHDLVFCFVNGEEFGLYGSKAFMDEFKGFDDVTERIRFGTNLESRGTDGTLIMFETGKNNYNTVKQFSEINKSVFTCSIATMVYDTMPNSTDFSNFKDKYQGLNMANISGGENYHTANDSYENVSPVYTSQQAQIVHSIIERLADYDLESLYDADETAIFFSYLNITTAVYNHTTVIILGTVLALMLIACVIIRIRKKASFKKTALSVLSVVITLVLSAGVTYALYYIFQLVAVLAGVIDIHMVGTITYSNVYIVIAIGLTALAVILAASRLSVKYLKVTSGDLIRAFAYVHAFLGAVVSFLLADASYLFVFSGIMLMIVQLLCELFPKTEKLHLEVLATALYMPICIPVIFLATAALGMTMAYVYGLVFALAIYAVGVVLMSCLTSENISEKCKHVFPIVLTAVIIAAVVILLAVSFTKPNAHVNLQGKQNIAKLPYDDALVYAVDKDGSEEYRIYDLNAKSFVEKYAPSLEYKDEYYAGNGENVDVEYEIKSTHEGNKINVTKYHEDSLVYLGFDNVTAKSFTVTDGKTEKTYSFKDIEGAMFTLHSDCTVTVNGGSADVEYREVLRDYEKLIPESYDEAENLHFNLWLTDSFTLG